MGSPINKIIGLKKSSFDESIKSKDGIRLRRARLIPLSKPGDEMTLTSIFLSSFKLVDEFKRYLFKELKLQNGGKVFVYTEVAFPDFKESRIDGLILIVKAGVIKDAALLEMKNKTHELNQEQVERYIQVAREYKIPKVVTVSNQFVSEVTQSPLKLKPLKTVQVFHLSWSHILTIAHVLLFKNDMNIRDEDQVKIMEEIVAYIESPVSGVIGVTQMRKGWDELTKNIHAGSHITIKDPLVNEAVLSWQQQERDMALMLSRKVGVFVVSGQKKFKADLAGRLANDCKKLVDTKTLDSTLRVKNAVSDISIKGLFEKKAVEMSVKISIPTDKTVKGQIGWMKRQIETCRKKSQERRLSTSIDSIIDTELKVDINIKHSKNMIRVPYNSFDSILEVINKKEINYFSVVLVKDFRSAFSSRKKFVQTLDSMLLDFYRGLVEHLVNWKQPSPKVVEDNYFSDIEYFIENSDISIDEHI